MTGKPLTKPRHVWEMSETEFTDHVSQRVKDSGGYYLYMEGQKRLAGYTTPGQCLMIAVPYLAGIGAGLFSASPLVGLLTFTLLRVFPQPGVFASFRNREKA